MLLLTLILISPVCLGQAERTYQPLQTVKRNVTGFVLQRTNSIYNNQVPQLRALRERAGADLKASVDLTVREVGDILDASTALQILAEYYEASSSVKREKALLFLEGIMTDLYPQPDSLATIAEYNTDPELLQIIEAVQEQRFGIWMEAASLKGAIERN